KCKVENEQITCQVIGLTKTSQAKKLNRIKFQLKREMLSPSNVRLWRLHIRDGKIVNREICAESNYLQSR
ncbi:MAG: hypothetical protein NZ937_05690, partial [Armatimonadetes bacterium]|nr:hypothetical protein [Armatimonadota bacterium]